MSHQSAPGLGFFAAKQGRGFRKETIVPVGAGPWPGSVTGCLTPQLGDIHLMLPFIGSFHGFQFLATVDNVSKYSFHVDIFLYFRIIYRNWVNQRR